MPDEEIARRGGAVRVRTQKLPGGKYRRIYIVRKAGPRGGHTVTGETRSVKHESSTRQGHGATMDPDTQPTYRIKPRRPDPEKVKRATKRR